MKFSDAMLEMANRYNECESESEMIIEIRRGNTLVLVPFKFNIEDDHEDQSGNPAVSIGSIHLIDEILEVFEGVEDK